MFRLFGILTVFFLVTAGMAAGDIKITASVDRNPVALEDQFTYQVEISGETSSLPEVKLPDLSEFAVIMGPSTSSSMQIINFKMSATKTYTLVLMPRQVGQFRIGAATAEYKGKTYASNTIELQVVKGGGQTRGSRKPSRSKAPSPKGNIDLSRALYLKAVPSKKTVYVNEQVNVTYKIYFRVNIQNPNFVKLPQTVGFWVEEYPIDKNVPIHQEVVDGMQYNVAVIRKLALFPTKAGDLEITPMELELEAVVRRNRNRDPFDIFDDFFQSSFGQVVRRKLISNPITIHVRALPEAGKPQNFSGLVGDFRLVSNLDKSESTTDEAVSLKLKINGTGNLKVLNELPIKFPAGLEVYDPKIQEKVDHSGEYISASKEFEYVIVPRVPAEYKLNPVRIPFFDPFKKEYRWLQSPQFTLRIAKGNNFEESLRGGYLEKEEVQLLGKDIHFIKEKLDLLPLGYQPYRTLWFWAAFILPALVLAGALVYRNYLDKMSSDVQYARQRKAHRMARRRLREARQLMNANAGSAEFYGEIARALLGYVADKTNRPAAGLVKTDLNEILASKKVEPQVIEELIGFLDEADFRRFAPVAENGANAREFYQKAERILIQLEKYL